MSKDYRPPWACKEWGAYEHDWISCPECLENLEVYEIERGMRDSVPPGSDVPLEST